MKKVFILLALAFFILTSLSAQEKEIIIVHQSTKDVHNKEKWTEDDRSQISILHITHNNNHFFISSEKQLSNISIRISNNIGNILYTSIISIDTNEQNDFIVEYLSIGEYCIEIETETDYYFGYFTIK